MGYQTKFNGSFDVAPRLKKEHTEYLRKFAETRRMARNAHVAETMPDYARIAVGLPIGPEGAYFVGGTGMCGQDRDGSIIRYNDPPSGQPGLWCKWEPNENGDAIAWNGAEKFYDYVEWLQYLITHFLAPWGYELNGEVSWEGEESEDIGKIVITKNTVKVLRGVVTYQM